MNPSVRRGARFVGLLMLAGVLCPALLSAAAKPTFQSKVITANTPGHAVIVEVDVSKAKVLYLAVTDGGNGYSCDWADWAEPHFVGPKGVRKLTELKWKSATTGWGKVNVNANCGGKPLSIDGKSVPYGIGTHANSLIAYEIPEGYDKFRAKAGLDDGGTNQTAGNTSVQFAVYLDEAPRIAANANAAAPGSREPLDAVAGLDVADGLEATLFASEPMLLSPTNIDVDHRGRVWVCECVNYRGRNGTRKEGDRILILEDTDGDGKADKQTVYYQGRDVDSALGICVLGNKVIVSCAPNVFVFTDEDGDDKPDSKELLFTKVGQPQHDHSTHAFLFGPDGKLYWNVGNTGKQVCDKNGKPVVDRAGNPVVDNGKPYFGGMPFRCNLDGSDFEVLAHNFRNNYEVTVDSFGTLWQSDNDDDGNRGVRINFVMEFGNYGYKDEMTGAGWKSPRTGMHAEIPKRHWHLNDPGVVPNLLQTGQGSPTGICIYEGRLLPEVFHDQVIHCDAGPNVVRAYPAKRDKAGYKAESVDILYGARDKWFRPSDVCVAPDGSLIVADWYDPGVGGHRMGDIDKGRLFRVAPPKTPYKIPEYDLSTAAGAIEALKNPNLSVRYLAWTALNEMQQKAEPALAELFAAGEDENPRHRARALWLLANIEGRGAHYAEAALGDADPDIRITGLRIARRLKLDVMPFVRKLAKNPSPQVRRECAIALRHEKSAAMPALWAELAVQHDGKDRWYLEALGIGADLRWEECFDAWLEKVGTDWNTPAGRDIVWRSRATKAMPLLAIILLDPKLAAADRLRYFRAFDFHQPQSQEARAIKQESLLSVAMADHPDQAEIAGLALKHAGKVDIDASPQLKAAIGKALDRAKGTLAFVEMVERFGVTDRYPELLAMAQAKPNEQLGVEAMRLLLARRQADLINAAVASKDPKVAVATMQALGNSGDGRAYLYLLPYLSDVKRPLELRRQAVTAMAKTRNGAVRITNLAGRDDLDADLKQAAAAALHSSQWNDIKQRAAKLFPLPPLKGDKPLPPLAELVKRKGNPARGKLIYHTTGTCTKCHVVNGIGKEVGPNLSEIGAKLSRQAFYDSILFPSAGISHNYETYVLVTVDGNQVNGILVSQTPESVSLKGADAIVRSFKKDDIEVLQKQKISLMPADLQKILTVDDLVDVVEYLGTLKKAVAVKPATKK